VLEEAAGTNRRKKFVALGGDSLCRFTGYMAFTKKKAVFYGVE